MYEPSQDTLKKYAAVMVEFAINDGRGVSAGEVVQLTTQTPGIPLAHYNTELDWVGYKWDYS